MIIIENTHQDYSIEEKRLSDTVHIVKDYIRITDGMRTTLQDETVQAFIEYDYRDSSQSYDKISLNATLYAMLLKNYDGLLSAKDKPYFCRIDFQHENTGNLEQIYIGKMDLVEPGGSCSMVVDWRAPVASVYYEGRLGKIEYETPVGISKGELFLKRQFTIDRGNLKDIMDIDITTNDDFLQTALGESKDNKLKDIVSTIQQEQNAIIRAPLGQPLIIQGVAGSGKTTIALHRIAYLIYTYESMFQPRDFLIIAPNRLFLDYISNVLPELGADKVRQTTFSDFALDFINTRHKLVNSNDTLAKLLSNDVTKYEKQHLVECCKWKGSLIHLRVLERYLEDMARSVYPHDDFMVGGYLITTAKEICDLINEDYKRKPLWNCIGTVKKTLSYRLKNHKKEIMEQLERSFKNRIDYIMNTMEHCDERKQAIKRLIDEREESVHNLKKQVKTAVSGYMKQFPKPQAMSCYLELITSPELLCKYSNGEVCADLAETIAEHSRTVLNNHRLEPEDLAPLMILQHGLMGTPLGMDARYVVVDEAQDFSPLQIYALKQILNTNLFTILGDLAQGIHGYRGISDWREFREDIFGVNGCEYRTLQQSYRTTIEIMDFANNVLGKCSEGNPLPAKPVVRHGPSPQVVRMASQKELLEGIIKHIEILQEEGYQSIAIIGKNDTECSMIGKKLAKLGLHVQQLSDKDNSYHAGTLIVPSYLSKGLEFDAVVVVSIDNDYSTDDLDIKLLYVAMTRALHRLDVYCISTNLQLLN